MTHYRLMAVMLFIGALSIPTKAESGRENITAAQVAAAIGNAGVNVVAEQVTLLSDVVAKTGSPALRVDFIGPWEGNLEQVRLNCIHSDECLPFVVTVRRRRGDDLERTVVSSSQQPSRRSIVDTPKPKVVAHVGSAATLLLDGGHVHIRLAVICLENGFVGQTIRVAGKGRERTYMAEVCSDGLLRGTL